ncbi:alpha-dehydro-beta-deoxy-D-glucarate aldolase [Skermanella stibiiresistens SB22]|uniref:Alpha-dehydro-beta-deoxy-D-glucarate aldolase n=1 Tax=Skermanella stibiiresistens SB22 TaxID=1385369 RepID=W9H7H0_9PROT|nr:HpcH/HpaI aldolase/citrate lyase family protein [Skermanella stibiiresistens]EWY39743.1 alpha-dehydro-beta-deoxy-D-glucarate aldolase [Skermanella stibiiresistens SB22]
MDMPLNPFKKAIKAGQQQIGLWSSLSSHVTVEIIAGSGFDWILIDTEHSPNELPMVHSQLQAATGGTAHPIVRPAWNDTVIIKRLLDAGVQSFLIPYVQTADEARQAVEATRYPPHGVRGFASASRASRFGRVKDYYARAHEEICVLVQIETQQGLDNLEAIAAVEGVDGVFIGPGDLSAALGYLGSPGHPEMQPVIEDAITRIKACGNVPGILTGDEKLARRYIELGCLFTAVGADLGILARGTEQLAAKFKTS